MNHFSFQGGGIPCNQFATKRLVVVFERDSAINKKSALMAIAMAVLALLSDNLFSWAVA